MTTIKSQKTVSPSSILIPGLNITTAIVLFLALTTLVPLKFSSEIPNTLGLSILFFNNLNILIACCEIVLGKHIAFIQQDYQRLQKLYRKDGKGGNEWQAGFLAFSSIH